MKQKGNFHFGVGTSSILMIFVVLCLTVFAVLSFSTARADQRLTEKALAGTAAYYAADVQAEETLAQIDGILAEVLAAAPENYMEEAAAALSTEGISISLDGGGLSGTADFSVGEDRVYRLSFRVNPVGADSRYTVTARRVENTGIWEDEFLDVWEGS